MTTTKTKKKPAKKAAPKKRVPKPKASVLTKEYESDKTYREWLTELPSPHRERALACCRQSLIDQKAGSWVEEPQDAILGCFSWDHNTPGFQYWAMVYYGRFHEAEQILAEHNIPKKPWWKFW